MELDVESDFGFLLGEKWGVPKGSCAESRCNVHWSSCSFSAFPSASQVLVQGCLLDPSQREAFLQQVYEQLCLFEDKVATMLQQQYEPQSQVSGKKEDRKQRAKGSQQPTREEREQERKRARGKVNSQDRHPVGQRQLRYSLCSTASYWEKV